MTIEYKFKEERQNNPMPTYSVTCATASPLAGGHCNGKYVLLSAIDSDTLARAQEKSTLAVASNAAEAHETITGHRLVVQEH